ncbi:MAG TPA: hypothetical protein VGO02_03790 [Burkholderiales bacterium]|nr:hypothetical protein [Burkholderiales bacterium]
MKIAFLGGGNMASARFMSCGFTASTSVSAPLMASSGAVVTRTG